MDLRSTGNPKGVSAGPSIAFSTFLCDEEYWIESFQSAFFDTEVGKRE